MTAEDYNNLNNYDVDTMTVEELESKIEKIHTDIFYEEMADFMNWDAYYRLTAELRYLEGKLKELKSTDSEVEE